jgi:hypothetical protein
MERRRSKRARCILPCEVVARRKVVEGTVRNVSAGGLALEAPLPVAQAGDTLEIRLRPPQRPVVEIAAVVWHVRTLRPGRAGPIGRFGLVLSEAAEDYFAFLASLLPAPRAARPAPGAAPGPAVASFAVQVAQAGSPRTRRILVRAADEEEARALALAEAGGDWSVVAVGRHRAGRPAQ